MRLANNKVALTHNFTFAPGNSAVNSDSTPYIWAVMGTHHMTSVISISEDKWVKDSAWVVPFFAELAECPDKPSVLGLSVPSPPTEQEKKDGASWVNGVDFVKLSAHPGILPIPPEVVHVLSGFDSDDAGALCVALIKYLVDADTMEASLTAPSDAADEESNEPPPPGSATPPKVFDGPSAKRYGFIAQWLWFVAGTSAVRTSDKHPRFIQVDPVLSGNGQKWAIRLTETYLASHPPNPAVRFATGGDSTLPTGLQDVLTDIATGLHDQATALHRKRDSSTTAKGFARLDPAVQQMILFASERNPPGSVDSSGASIGGHTRSAPCDQYKAILESPSIAQAKMNMDHVLRNRLLLPNFRLSDSLVNALRDGNLLFHGGEPGAFSFFGMGPHNFTGAGSSAHNAALHSLSSNEGKGLSDSQITKMAKILHQVPYSWEDFKCHLQNWNGLLSILFGSDAAITKAVSDWWHHCLRNQIAYATIARSNPLIYIGVGVLLDNACQQHLNACMAAATITDPGITEPLLDLPDAQRRIRQGLFAAPVFPLTVQRLCGAFQTPPHARLPPPPSQPTPQWPWGPSMTPPFPTPPFSPPAATATTKKAKVDGDPVINQNPINIPDLSNSQLLQLTRRAHSAPKFEDCQACLNWHVRGRCHSKCARVVSHRATAAYIKDLANWCTTTKAAL